MENKKGLSPSVTRRDIIAFVEHLENKAINSIKDSANKRIWMVNEPF